MKIETNKVVTIDYTLTDDQHTVIDTSEGQEPLAYLHGNGNLIPGLENALTGQSPGASLKVVIPPEEGYGLRDDSLVGDLPRTAFAGAEDVKPGMRFQARGPQGVEMLTVVSVSADAVTVDRNHPLAGATLHFDVTVREIREATEHEIEHGHVHRPGCQHH
jgi:FKBP-type peptidyl-prolyl cis-trans isomerase SlyD